MSESLQSKHFLHTYCIYMIYLLVYINSSCCYLMNMHQGCTILINVNIQSINMDKIKAVRQLNCKTTPDWKNSHRLSERLASLDIRGTRLRATLKTLDMIVLWWSEEFQGALNCSPMMPRDAILSDSCTPDRCSFSSLGHSLVFSNWDRAAISDLSNFPKTKVAWSEFFFSLFQIFFTDVINNL